SIPSSAASAVPTLTRARNSTTSTSCSSLSQNRVDHVCQAVHVILVVVYAQAHPPSIPPVIGDDTPVVGAPVQIGGVGTSKGEEVAPVRRGLGRQERASPVGVEPAQ